MTVWFDLLKVGVFISGASLIACAFIAGIKLTFPNKPISQKERILRSLAVWFLTSLLTPGILLMISAFSSQKFTLEDVARIIFASIIFLPLTLAAGIGTYSKLEDSTKLPGDLLFLDDNKKPKD